LRAGKGGRARVNDEGRGSKLFEGGPTSKEAGRGGPSTSMAGAALVTEAKISSVPITGTIETRSAGLADMIEAPSGPGSEEYRSTRIRLSVSGAAATPLVKPASVGVLSGGRDERRGWRERKRGRARGRVP
jgi:hypothetical protein